ncbi:DUF4395 domain-containing protein [Lihuaxuella thermophila]|uniref:DUF4395 domain-containing protein n=1 Tax=Lihuaxuella thermophila TaxID=1173111 RepID=A0A1H8D935_9BACL|nr:DUF4395 domain-containing protein [Lihuaxuella thermophila]SEN03759.1 protein of unknown function [Lihuaxuella thermophila]
MKGIPVPFVRANQWFILLSVLLTLVLGLPEILLIPLLAGLYSLAFKQNPVFGLVRPFLKKPPSDYEQEDPEQQRFNQWIAVICLGLSYLGFATGYGVAGYIFMIMVGAASLLAILGFCIGCFIRYQYIQWKHRRQSG